MVTVQAGVFGESCWGFCVGVIVAVRGSGRVTVFAPISARQPGCTCGNFCCVGRGAVGGGACTALALPCYFPLSVCKYACFHSICLGSATESGNENSFHQLAAALITFESRRRGHINELEFPQTYSY